MREQKYLMWFIVIVLTIGLAGCQLGSPGGNPKAPAQDISPAGIRGAEQAPYIPAMAGRVHLPAVSGEGAEDGVHQAGNGGMQVYFPLMPVYVYAPTHVHGDEVDPHVDLDVSPAQLQVGQTVTVTATPVDIGLPYYYLYALDKGSTTPVELVVVTNENDVRQSQSSSAVLSLVSATGAMYSATFVLEAVALGETMIWVNAHGEVHYPDGARWTGGGSQPVLITVSD